ncbi:uncharacterized protein [Dermacentor albipictus]|uniref:uncharacterized protein isoform X2 n=1 Tax=Dermacentor albipictus TaxID=60249 RepID=UPI0031FD2A2A
MLFALAVVAAAFLFMLKKVSWTVVKSTRLLLGHCFHCLIECTAMDLISQGSEHLSANIDEAFASLLAACGQQSFATFDQLFSHIVLKEEGKFEKIAEGNNSEVFRIQTYTGDSVLKVVKLGYTQESQHRLLTEMKIASRLTALRDRLDFFTKGFVELKSVTCVFDKCPAELLEAREQAARTLHDERRDGNESARTPRAYLVWHMSYGGVPLDKIELNRVKLVEKDMEELKGARDEAVEFLKLENDIAVIENQIFKFYRLQKLVPEKEAKLKQLEAEMTKVSQQYQEAQEQLRADRHRIEELRSNAQANRSRSRVLDSLLQAKKSEQLPGVIGRLRTSCKKLGAKTTTNVGFKLRASSLLLLLVLSTLPGCRSIILATKKLQVHHVELHDSFVMPCAAKAGIHVSKARWSDQAGGTAWLNEAVASKSTGCLWFPEVTAVLSGHYVCTGYVQLPRGEAHIMVRHEIQDVCRPGYYSPGGLFRDCIPCDFGSYTVQHGSPLCLRCPPGMTTYRQGSTSPKDREVTWVIYAFLFGIASLTSLVLLIWVSKAWSSQWEVGTVNREDKRSRCFQPKVLPPTRSRASDRPVMTRRSGKSATVQEQQPLLAATTAASRQVGATQTDGHFHVGSAHRGVQTKPCDTKPRGLDPRPAVRRKAERILPQAPHRSLLMIAGWHYRTTSAVEHLPRSLPGSRRLHRCLLLSQFERAAWCGDVLLECVVPEGTPHF